MIKLTVNPKLNPVVHTFEKKVVLIGSGSSPDIDLILNELEQDSIQIKILDHNGYFLAINVANDASIKFNGLFFKKKVLKNNDLLQIGSVSIEFNHDLAEDPAGPSSSSETDKNDKPLDEQEKKLALQAFTSKPSNWKLLFSIIAAVIILFSICFSVFYVNIIEQTEKEEIKAIEGVADVAMALTYAQIHHINPLAQNWSNPDFLKNNFSSIIPSDYPFLVNIDSVGQFNNCPYILRIYTDHDFSSFLVIALPDSSLLQSIAPKNAIVVHSKTMELRKIEDLRALNRLLVNSNTLDGANGAEIVNLVKHGTLIPLAKLVKKTKDQGFAPPKALELRRPGAENYIYNAPRYYQFSDTYVRRALYLIKSSENGSHEMARLQHEILQMSKLPNLVLYSSDGIETAIQAEKAFRTLAPFGKFLNAYVISNSEGQILGSHLIMEADQSKFSKNDWSSVEFKSLDYENSLIGSVSERETSHPLEFQLSNLATARSESLKLIAEKINASLDRQIEEYRSEFSAELADLAIEFQQKDFEEKEKIARTLTKLYEDYTTLPLVETLSYVKAAGLEPILLEILAKQEKVLEAQDVSEELIGAEMQIIKKAKTFKELDESLTKAIDLLNLKFIPKPQLLMTYQNETKLLVIEKLEQFLLNANFQLPKSEFEVKNRDILNHILDISWITDPHEASFYLNEFDLLK